MVEALPGARGDRQLLRQVWTNLLSNAVKYSSNTPCPRIEITGCSNSAERVYCVKDNGVGFDMTFVEVGATTTSQETSRRNQSNA